MQQQKPLEGAQLVIMTIALSLATFMQVLDSTIANVAIPTIAGNLGSSLSQGTWVITSFGVANAISIPLTGWLAKRSSLPSCISARAIRVDILMPKAPERRPSIEAVGLLSPRSILWIIAREAPARSARSFSDQPRDSRSMRMRALMR